MLLAPLLLLVGFAIHPPEPHNGSQMLEVIAKNAARWKAAHIMFATSMVLSIPTTLGLMDLLERRGRPRFAFIGGNLVVVGVVFLTLFIGVERRLRLLSAWPQLAQLM